MSVLNNKNVDQVLVLHGAVIASVLGSLLWSVIASVLGSVLWSVIASFLGSVLWSVLAVVLGSVLRSAQEYKLCVNRVKNTFNDARETPKNYEMRRSIFSFSLKTLHALLQPLISARTSQNRMGYRQLFVI